MLVQLLRIQTLQINLSIVEQNTLMMRTIPRYYRSPFIVDLL